MRRIAFDVTDLVATRRRGRAGPNGVERVTAELLSAAHELRQGEALTPVYLDGEGLVRVLDGEHALQLAHGLGGVRDEAVPAVADDQFSLLLSTGSSWSRDRLQALHGRLNQTRRPALVALVHDVIPLSHPRFVSEAFAAEYRRWLDFVVAHGRCLLVPSELTKQGVRQYYPEAEDRLRTIALGINQAAARARAAERHAPQGAGGHILYVSSLVPRKNHEMLVRAWRAAFAREPMRNVPTLILAGSCKWKTRLRLTYLAGRLQRRLVITGNIPDRELETLTRSCGFFVFPSHAEGWGLPVSEALTQGKTGILSTAIPGEADGGLLKRLEPDDEAGWAREMHHLATQEPVRRQQEEAIRRNYVPGHWHDAVRAVLEACQ